MQRICVRIDFERLRERLAREYARPVPEMEAHHWLHKAGFVLEGYWMCDHEIAVQQLKPDEILELTRTVHENGVHFVDRNPSIAELG